MRLFCFALIAFTTLRITSPVHAEEMPALSSIGENIIDDRGNIVQLRGVNLGGWLVEEIWMMPIAKEPPVSKNEFEIIDHTTLWRCINQRFGSSGVTRLRTALRKNWLNESDFERINKLGFNCVRLPFLASLFDEPGGWQWLDNALLWAKKNHIYVVLDMHGAPGSQSKDHHTGEAGRNEFFKIDADIVAGEKLWATIAKRYKNHSEVAGYDLLNEPMGASDVTQLYQVQNRLYQSIRSVDQNHLIFVEDGYTGEERMPDPKSFNWQHIAYSVHHYFFEAKSADEQMKACERKVGRLERLQAKWNVPIYLGEFNIEPHATAEVMKSFTDALNKHNWAWSAWCYKVVMKHHFDSMWGIYENPSPPLLMKPWSDSEAQMMEKMKSYRTEKLGMNEAWQNVLRK